MYQQVRDYFNRHLKLGTRNWLSDIHDPSDGSTIVEVRFKNTRKQFCDNAEGLDLQQGDVVAVEAPTGHDIGLVSLTGYLAQKQFKRKIRQKKKYKFPLIYRKARPSDIEKWRRAKSREIAIRNRAREIVRQRGIEMKVSDVEVQGDHTKAIFYYLADGRVDFRELIRMYAREFQLKVEMRQIGARQEASLIGGLDTSGREICGSAWKWYFESVKIAAAKIQQLPANARKLTGHCGKLKPSLMYELDTYLEAWQHFPEKIPVLKTAEGTWYPQKTDVLQQKVWYSPSPDSFMNAEEVPLQRLLWIAWENQKGKQPPLRQDQPAQSGSDAFTSGSSDILTNKTGPNNKRQRRRKSKSSSHAQKK